MRAAKCRDLDYIDFLVASPHVFSCTEAGRVQGPSPGAPAHDAFTRLLTRLEPDPEALWREAEGLIDPRAGVLVIDDSTLDKPYAERIDLVTSHWSGKHHRVARGINLITLLWTDGDRKVPVDYRLYDKADGRTKNDHFWEMMLIAKGRGFAPRYVLFDGWYASLENLKQVRGLGWHWLTRLKHNRKVNPDGRGAIALSAAEVSASGTTIHLVGYGLVRVFKLVARDGGIEYWATGDAGMGAMTRQQMAEWSYAIENYHRDLKQCCGVERSQARSGRAQRNHIGMALRAFLRLEHHFFTAGVSCYEAKRRVVREAVRRYIRCPLYRLPASFA
jgi:DDE superfamily endonuclease